MDTQTQEKATVWLKPDQVDAMRSATVEASATYLATRNDALIATLYDSGLRVSEAIALDIDDHLDLDDGVIALPADLQKDYPTDRSPSYTEIELADETVRTLRMYLAGRWKDTAALWPSRQSERMSTESVRNVVRDAAVAADVRHMTVAGGG